MSFEAFCKKVDSARAVSQYSLSKKESKEIRKTMRLLNSYSQAGTLLEKIKKMSKQEQKDEIVRMALTFLIEVQNRPDGNFSTAPQLLSLLNKLLRVDKVDVQGEEHQVDSDVDLSDELDKLMG